MQTEVEEKEKLFLIERAATKCVHTNTVKTHCILDRKLSRKINPTLSWDMAMKFLKTRELFTRSQREPRLVSLRVKSCDHVSFHQRAQKE